MDRAIPLTLAGLRSAVASGASRAGYSPLGPKALLLLDTDGPGPDPHERPTLQAWLRALPCPSLALGDGVLAGACDARIASLDDAGAIATRVRQTPLAAATLVQLLRAIEGLDTVSALTAESLAYATLQSGPEFRAWLAAQPPPEPLPEEPGPAVLLDREDAQLRIELNRPAARNSMTVAMRDALLEALQLVRDDPTITQVVLSGRGKCFSTGGELREFGTAPDAATAHAVRSVALPGRELAACAERVTARLHGACIGSGIEFPAFAGRVEAAPGTWFQLPELRFGLIPGAGGCVSIGRRIGRQRTAAWVLSGEVLDLDRALAWGLVDARLAS